MTVSTTVGSLRPQPVFNVSAMWDSKESVLFSTDAIPPWACQVFDSWSFVLHTMMTLQFSEACIAARRPAMPAPMIRQSVKSWLVAIESMLTK